MNTLAPSKRIVILALFLLTPPLVLMCSHYSASSIFQFAYDTELTNADSTISELNVISYNVFLRPRLVSRSDYAVERAREIGRWLAESGADVVALQEAWHGPAVHALIEQTSDEFPYYVGDQPGRFGFKLVSGGMLLLSKWPITSVRSMTYNDCYGFDCRAAKGAMDAVIQLNDSSRIHVVTTHLDAGEEVKDRMSRASQLTQLRQFIGAIEQNGHPILITGDFNINSLAGDTEFDRLVDILGVQDYPVENPSTINCELETSIFCEEPAIPKRLDYIFTRNRGEMLIRAETLHLKHATDRIDQFVRYLSDHRAVWAKFQLGKELF
ncbi:MAG: hypothetical protein GF372_14190 [Candidatus Marinimicrobia bacterium]|nr:hypothetical protein [Candidatus Neomarinimicrobiota bacterium]